MKAEGDVDGYQQQRERERPSGAALELAAYLRADYGELLYRGAGVDRTQGALDAVMDDLAADLRLGRQADRDGARGADVLHLRFAEAGGCELGAYRAQVHAGREAGLGAHPAREVDGEIEAAGEEHHDGSDHEDRRQAIPHVPCGHELEIGLMAEKFHERVLRSEER